ncbi:MAG: hypothetical protein KAH57_00755 [Thermoplasmata archaeon]|nr:hypothetical protein [Thermoplasmata archaeon]
MFKDDHNDDPYGNEDNTWINGMFKISIPRSMNQIKKSFFRWRKKKLIMGGISKITRSAMYIMILLVTLIKGSIEDPLPFIMGILIGLRGFQLLVSGSFKLLGAYRSIGKTRSDDPTAGPINVTFYKSLWLIYLIPILTYFFIFPTLTTPIDLSRNHSWYIWPLIFVIYWIIWRIVLRALLHAYVRAYIVGNKLARLHHDKMIISIGHKYVNRTLKRLINSSYIPIISLMFLVVISGLLKVIYSIFRTFVLERIYVDTIGDLIIDTILEGNFSLNDTIFPSLPIWMAPLILYFVNVALIFTGAYTRSRIRSVLYNRKGFKSSVGRLIDIFMNETENNTDPSESSSCNNDLIELETGKLN